MLNQVSERLKKNIPEILNRWEKRAYLEVKASNLQETLALRDSLPEYLYTLAHALSDTRDLTEQSRLKEKIETTRIARMHAQARAVSFNYTIDQLIMEYHILRQVIFEVMDREKELTLAQRELITCSIEQAVNNAATEFSDIVKEATLMAYQEDRKEDKKTK
jgi:hypothetical protein